MVLIQPATTPTFDHFSNPCLVVENKKREIYSIRFANKIQTCLLFVCLCVCFKHDAPVFIFLSWLHIGDINLIQKPIFNLCSICRHYSIVAPEVVRPNSEYHVAVSLHESSTPCEIRVGIEGTANRYANFREVNLQPYTSQLLRFSTGYMEPGQYRLNAEGLSGIDFRNEKPLSLVLKNASIFVQSDKAIYKPGDLVRFRILVLDLNMKPVPSAEPINIFITVN